MPYSIFGLTIKTLRSPAQVFLWFTIGPFSDKAVLCFHVRTLIRSLSQPKRAAHTLSQWTVQLSPAPEITLGFLVH